MISFMKTTMMSAAFASMSMAAMASGMPDVTGTIVDDKGNPMEFVNVVLLSLPDSTFVQGATSDMDGKFNITTPETGGLLKISSIGYETLYYPISATGANQSSPFKDFSPRCSGDRGGAEDRSRSRVSVMRHYI